jgi:hypothetical protein
LQFFKATPAVGRIVLIAVIAGLVGFPSGQLPQLERPLFALSGAFNIRWSDRGDGEVSFEMDEAYPADSALRALHDWLSRMAWTPLKEDLWNPGQPSSNVGGWRDFVDGSVNPERRVYRWIGHWRNERGDVVTYVFRYDGVDARPNSAARPPVHVDAAFYKAETLRLLRIKVPGH